MDLKIIGAGSLGTALGERLRREGHVIMFGGGAAANEAAARIGAEVGSKSEAAEFGGVVVLAVKVSAQRANAVRVELVDAAVARGPIDDQSAVRRAVCRERLMAPITFTIEVARPPEEAFAYVTDPTRFVEWQRNVVSGHMDPDGPHGVGARCLTTRRIGFAERPVTSELTHIDPPRTWGVRGIDGPIRAIVDVTVDPLENGRSRVTIELEFAGHGIGKLLVPLVVRPEARKEMPANLRTLKERLEGRR